MQTKDLVLGVIIFVLAITSAIFWVRSATGASREQAASQMSASLGELFKDLGYPQTYPECRSLPAGGYEQFSGCIAAARATKDLTKLFKEDKFQNDDPKTNKTGYFVIANMLGGRTFASENFSLNFNNAEIARGCAAKGDIAPGFTCRFELVKFCAPGDNLEIRYNGQRAFLKTC